MSKSSHAIYLMVIGGLAITLFGRQMPETLDQVDQPPSHRIVVYPFTSMTDQSEPAASALTSALIHSLDGAPNISIVSLTDLPAGMQDSGRHDRWPKDGTVTLFVEGAVGASDGGTRVTVQIIDAMTDEHVWANTYESNGEATSEFLNTIEDQVLLIASK